MYYLNSFLLYGLLGFIMESTLFKISEPSRVSGVLYGPITLVYGLGGIALTLADKYILSKIKCNKVLEITELQKDLTKSKLKLIKNLTNAEIDSIKEAIK